MPLSDLVAQALRMQRMWLLKLQKRKGTSSGFVRGFADGWVFPSRTGGLSHPSVLAKPFKAVIKEIGLEHPVTSHDARRTFNTLACQAGVPNHVIQAIIGHSSDQMTMHYRNVEIRERHQGLALVIDFAKLTTKVGDQVGGSGSKRDNAPRPVRSNGASS